MAPGTSVIDPSSVRGIAQLVASSVPGLQLNKVTITGSSGQLLWPSAGGGSGGSGGSSLQEAEQRYDQTTQANLEAMLAQTLEGRLAGARDKLGAVVLMQGRVADVTHGSETAGALDSATIQGTGTDARRQMRLELQSEFLLAVEDGAVLAATPDLICLLAHETGDPIVIERLRYGQAVVVIAAPASEIWRSDAGLALAGPRAFGYGLEYSPIIAEA